MKLPALRSAFASAVLLATAAIAQAHPGHEGDHGDGGLTWDFGHLVDHPAATLICAVVLVAAALGAARFIGAVSNRPERVKSKHRR